MVLCPYPLSYNNSSSDDGNKNEKEEEKKWWRRGRGEEDEDEDKEERKGVGGGGRNLWHAMSFTSNISVNPQNDLRGYMMLSPFTDENTEA